MLTPVTQDKSCVSIPDKVNTITSEQSTHFHGWKIAELAPKLLLRITRHLSLEDTWNLALASRKIHSVLEEFGELEIISYYYSLPKKKRLFYRDMSVTNPQLIQHLRSSKINAITRQLHCPENLPAICAYHAYHLHNETVNATSINFVFKNKIEQEDGICAYYLNNNHNRLITRDRDYQISIWSVGDDDSWNKEFTIRQNQKSDFYKNIDQYHGNTFFLPLQHHSLGRDHSCGKDVLLSIIERNDCGVWSETQRITFDELFPLFRGKRNVNFNIFSVQTSPDGKSLIYSTRAARSVILGRELNGRWAVKGDCPRGYSVDFSPDSNHIVVNREKCVKFYGKQKDGSWLATGTLNLTIDTIALIKAGIEEDDLHGFNKIAFSPDSHHLAACFNNAGSDFKYKNIHVEDFFVIIASLDDNGEWSETTRIVKPNRIPTFCTSLDVTFSPNGKYLVVHGKYSFDIWQLTDDNSWTPVVKDHDQHFHKPEADLWEIKTRTPKSTVQFNTDSSVFLLLREGYAMVWQLNESGIWESHHSYYYPHRHKYIRCSDDSTLVPHPKLSADGHSIIYTNPQGRFHARLQAQHGQWTRQTQQADSLIYVYALAFNQEGDLLTGISVKDDSCLIVLGITPNGTWKEKGRLQLEERILNCKFSDCGRSIMIGLINSHEQKLLSFWNIERA